MACSNSFRVDILAIFLFSTILFSFVSNTSYESFAFSNDDIEIKNNPNKIENANAVKYIKKTAIDHTISLSESMGLSTPEEKKDLGSLSIDDQKKCQNNYF